jgi:hypothetical protein
MHINKQTVLLGSSDRLPFSGEFYLRLELSMLNVEIIGRVGASLRPEESWEAHLTIREALKMVSGDTPLTATRSVWDNLLAIPRRDFGPNLGGDLSMMVVARTGALGALSAIGLKSIWGLSADNCTALIVGPDMPQVNTVGIPTLPPKALEFEDSDTVFVGSVLSTNEPSPSEVASLIPGNDARLLG